MDQAARHRSTILKARVRCPVSPWEIWGGQSNIGKRFFSRYFGSSTVSIIVSIPHTHLNLLTPNVNYSDRTAPLTSKVAFYIFIQQI